MRKRVLTLLFGAIITGMALPSVAFAQPESGCTISLAPIVAELVEAQALGITDLDAGLAALTAARADLAAITAACSEAGVLPVRALTARYAAPNGTFTLNIPQGWVSAPFRQAEGGGIAYFGNTQAAANALTETQPILAEGEQAVAVAVLPPQLIGTTEGASVSDALSAFAAQTVSENFTIGEVTTAAVAEREVARLPFSGGEEGSLFEGELSAFALPDDSRYLLLITVAPAGELAALRPTAEAIALSVR